MFTSFDQSSQDESSKKKRACLTDRHTGLMKCQCGFGTQPEEEFPVINVKLGESVYSLLPEFYVVRQWDQCYLKFVTMPMSDSHNFWILGDAFLLNYLTVFDLQNKQIAFLEALHSESFDWKSSLFYIALSIAFFGGAFMLGKDYIAYWWNYKR